jgi:hypothetical protein
MRNFRVHPAPICNIFMFCSRYLSYSSVPLPESPVPLPVWGHRSLGENCGNVKGGIKKLSADISAAPKSRSHSFCSVLANIHFFVRNIDSKADHFDEAGSEYSPSRCQE